MIVLMTDGIKGEWNEHDTTASTERDLGIQGEEHKGMRDIQRIIQRTILVVGKDPRK